jgi:hypothetical protein
MATEIAWEKFDGGIWGCQSDSRTLTIVKHHAMKYQLLITDDNDVNFRININYPSLKLAKSWARGFVRNFDVLAIEEAL